MVGNHHLHVPRRCERVPELVCLCIQRPPSWGLHDAPSSGMSLIGCEESADEAGPKELGDTRDTCSARSRDGHAGSVLGCSFWQLGHQIFQIRTNLLALLFGLSREWAQRG